MLTMFLLAAAQAAAPAAQPTPAPTPAVERKICRAEAVTGSIMPARRICHTRAEWAAIDTANGRGVDSFRNRPQTGLAPGGG